MTRLLVFVAAGVALSGWAISAFGHGNPIDVVAADDRLSVAGELSLERGFARLASDPHEDAAFDFGPNSTLRTNVPGFNITGFDFNAGLDLEILSRPDFSAQEHPNRWLWYWSPTSGEVSTTATDAVFSVLPIFGTGSIRVQRSQLIAGPTLSIADPVGPYLGADQHLLEFRLQNSPAAPVGVYGVFARFSSPGLESSEPFLLVFRHGVLAENFATAAEAINFAATLPGDYNHDDTVDAADYTVWRDTLGSETALAADGSGNQVVDAADHDVWQSHFGETVGDSPGGANSVALPGNSQVVPEPVSIVPLAWLAACLTAGCRRRAAPVRTLRKAT